MADTRSISNSPLFQDLTEKQIGRWFVIRYSHRGCKRNHFWVCRCVCGVEDVLESGAIKYRASTKCGHRVMHGKTLTPEYTTWRRIHTRCYNVNDHDYADYGARGITVCERWHLPNGFVNFLADMGSRPTPQHSIDRIKGNLGYSPDNCRWATKKEQAQNRHNVIWFTHDGVTLCATDWADRKGIRPSIVYKRLRRGWSVFDAIMTPLTKQKKP